MIRLVMADFQKFHLHSLIAIPHPDQKYLRLQKYLHLSAFFKGQILPHDTQYTHQNYTQSRCLVVELLSTSL